MGFQDAPDSVSSPLSVCLMLRSLQAGKAHSKQLSSRLLLLGFPSEVGGTSRSCSGGGRVCGARKTGSGEHPAELRGGCGRNTKPFEGGALGQHCNFPSRGQLSLS